MESSTLTSSTLQQPNKKTIIELRKLEDADGNCFDDLANMCRIAQRYFEQLFSSTQATYDPVISMDDTRITSEDNNLRQQFASAPFTIGESKTLIFQMHLDKSPGPDGLNPAFYQKFWNLICGIFIMSV